MHCIKITQGNFFQVEMKCLVSFQAHFLSQFSLRCFEALLLCFDKIRHCMSAERSPVEMLFIFSPVTRHPGLM